VAIIMDGNGRWAEGRGLPRSAGHGAGARAVRRVVRAAPALGIGTLTLYAFSSDNWRRPAAEVATLMELFERYLVTERETCRRHGIRINVIGRRDRFAPQLLRSIRDAERATAAGRRLHLRLAVDYSSRHAITVAAGSLPRRRRCSFAEFSQRLNRAVHSAPAAPDVDLLIRTSGERRLSDFLLWECAYAEFVFTRRPWPAFGRRDLVRALEEFRSRERRFGRLSRAV
jgi:undecaprenyl diphosphate synthase